MPNDNSVNYGPRHFDRVSRRREIHPRGLSVDDGGVIDYGTYVTYGTCGGFVNTRGVPADTC